MTIRRFALFGVLALAPGVAAQEVPLRAGVARVEITPGSLMSMYGYSKRSACGPDNRASGTHDPLFAKVLVLETGESRVAIVTLDVGEMMSDRLHREIAEKLGIPVLLLAASHTHSGPLFVPSPGEHPGADAPAYMAEVERKIFNAVSEAAKSLFPARLAVGRGSLQLGYNRLLPRDDGRSRALFENPERVPYGPVDPEFMILKVEDAQGTARALVVHYACHPVVLGPTNCKYSADYVGAMEARVEADLPGTQCMFVQGGGGDVNPLFLARTGDEEQDFTTVRKMGDVLAGQVLRTAAQIPPGAPNRYPIQYTSEELTFPNRWDKAAQPIELGITTVLINREIAMAAVPGEPFHRLQTLWKARAEVPYPLFYGYTYSSGGGLTEYIPDLRSAAHGGYGADVSTEVAVGAGETLMEHHLINLYRLLGMWRDRPGRP